MICRYYSEFAIQNGILTANWNDGMTIYIKTQHPEIECGYATILAVLVLTLILIIF